MKERQGDEDVGYRQPPKSTRFRKGLSGNPRGRPRNRRRQFPHEALLGQMVTIRDEGRERRVTAAEAFLLQLAKKGLEGCGASARATLAGIENARTARQLSEDPTAHIQFRIMFRSGLCCTIEDLGMAVRLNGQSEDNVKLMLKPWIVEAALTRISAGELSREEQRIILAAARTPEKVRWPDWWTECP